MLSLRDRDLYRRIFQHQERGEWGAADRLVRRLDDRILMGHVLGQRYLHPTKYRSRFGELARWLESYADHPEARRIHRLAMRRKPPRARSPRRPPSRRVVADAVPHIIELAGYRPARRAEARAMREVRRMVHRERLSRATAWINRRGSRQALGRMGYQLARTRIASGWFFYGDAARAFRVAGGVAAGHGDRLPYSHWIAGLSGFRLARYGAAMEHFAAVAGADGILGWDRSAAAFWAARAAVRGGRPERAAAFLRRAAERPRTFYGGLARRWLGDRAPFDWRCPPLTGARLARLRGLPATDRVLALVEVGDRDRADRDLRARISETDPDLAEALLALADRLSLPATAYRAGVVLGRYPGRGRVAALYPVPLWEPEGGFKIDRALIYAFMRQESGFNTRARSRVGARGLMQLMPATAGFVAGRRFGGVRRDLLYEPERNVTLGQGYVLHLLGNEVVGGDVLRLAAAYNGGPGNLRKWLRRVRRAKVSDPLMFIESLRSRETRIFVERVLANLWMYRERLGEPAPTLDALASGRLPVYVESGGGWAVRAVDARH